MYSFELIGAIVTDEEGTVLGFVDSVQNGTGGVVISLSSVEEDVEVINPNSVINLVKPEDKE